VKDEWTKSLPDGRKVTYTYEPMLADSARITATVQGEPVGQMITLPKVKNPLSREEVELHFEFGTTNPATQN